MVSHSAAPSSRLWAGVCALGLTAALSACATDRRVGEAATCVKVGELAEAFPPGYDGPSGTGDIIGPAEALSEELQDRRVKEAAARLAAVETSAVERVETLADRADGEPVRLDGDPDWYADLGTIDTWAIENCEFSLTTLILEDDREGDQVEPAPRPTEGLEGILDWVDVLDRVDAVAPKNDWTDLGYQGNVGEDPGVDVTVTGPADIDEASVVCADISTALADIAGPLSIRVATAGGFLLVERSPGGGCTPV